LRPIRRGQEKLIRDFLRSVKGRHDTKHNDNQFSVMLSVTAPVEPCGGHCGGKREILAKAPWTALHQIVVIVIYDRNTQGA